MLAGPIGDDLRKPVALEGTIDYDTCVFLDLSRIGFIEVNAVRIPDSGIVEKERNIRRFERSATERVPDLDILNTWLSIRC